MITTKVEAGSLQSDFVLTKIIQYDNEYLCETFRLLLRNEKPTGLYNLPMRVI
jgi:hypothetical protein